MRWMIDQFAMEKLCERSREDDPFHLFSQGPDDAAEQISSTLSGESDGHREALAQRMGRKRAAFDIRAAELMAYAGIDPLSVAVMEPITGAGLSIRPWGTDEDGPCTVHIERDGRNVSGFVRLSPAVVWQFGGEVTIAGLPETFEIAAQGRRLAEVITHPVLDRRPYVVRSTRRETFGDTTYVHLGIMPPMIMQTARELMETPIGDEAWITPNLSIAA